MEDIVEEICKGFVNFLVLLFCCGVLAVVLFVILVVGFFLYFPQLRLAYAFLSLSGSFAFFVVAVWTIRERTNAGAISWKDAAYFSIIASASLFTFAYWLWVYPGQEAVSLVPLQYFCLAITVSWTLSASWRSFTLRNIHGWEGISCEVQGEELKSLQESINRRCKEYAGKYEFSMTLERAFKVSNPILEERFDEFCDIHKRKGKPSNKQQLFHGTSKTNAMSIIKDGFVLPRHAGMFGKGVYFADTPLKSMQYARVGGTILLCQVELGNTKIQRAANPRAENDLKRGWFMRELVKAPSYDSVTAPGGFFAAVRVPEYAVYDPSQIVPRYLLCVKKVSSCTQNSGP